MLKQPQLARYGQSDREAERPVLLPRCGAAGDMATLSHAGILRSLNFGARAPKSASAAA